MHPNRDKRCNFYSDFNTPLSHSYSTFNYIKVKHKNILVEMSNDKITFFCYKINNRNGALLTFLS